MTIFIFAKALAARSRGEPYRFSAIDGGMVFTGKDTSPTVMLAVAGAMAIGTAAGLWLLLRH